MDKARPKLKHHSRIDRVQEQMKDCLGMAYSKAIKCKKKINIKLMNKK